jgi:hypothetical protein
MGSTSHDFLPFFTRLPDLLTFPTHLPCFLARPRLHSLGLALAFLGLDLDLTAGNGGARFPAPLNVTLEGNAKIADAGDPL